MRPRHPLARQQAGIGIEFVKITADRQCIPDPYPVMGQAGHEKGGEQQEFGTHRRVIAIDHDRFEIDAPENLHKQPTRNDQEP